jgi:hypothetical protein
MSFLDKLKSMFSGGSSDAGVQPAAEPDAARAADRPEAAAPMPPADPAGMPTAEPQPPEPQAGVTLPDEPEDRAE